MPAAAALATSTVLFQVQNMDRGETFGLFLGVDLNDDGQLGSGDLAGYYDGTTLAPILDPAGMRLFPLRQSLTGMSFGVGPLP